MHSSRDKALWFLFFDKKTGISAYCEVNPQVVPANINQDKKVIVVPSYKLFAKISAANIGTKQIFAIRQNGMTRFLKAMSLR
ncbi:hypothetical protein [Sporomusa silvacetica]|uniref:hypothetical protein n=1 Tax=Sporomusa silvacetica TaxID=55504 RepID=UPI000B99F2CC|nr:hypothetical protein [Sporomusa silvacetica]